MKFHGRLNKVEKTLASMPATGDATTGKPFRRFWLWCAGLLKREDLTDEERAGWADHRARCRERVMADPTTLLLYEQCDRLGLPRPAQLPDDVIAEVIRLRAIPTPSTS